MRHPRRLSDDDLELISWAQNLHEPYEPPVDGLTASTRAPMPVRTPAPARPDVLAHLERSGDDPGHCPVCTAFLSWLFRRPPEGGAA